MPTHTISHHKQSPPLPQYLCITWNNIRHTIFVVFTFTPYIRKLCDIQAELCSQGHILPSFKTKETVKVCHQHFSMLNQHRRNQIITYYSPHTHNTPPSMFV